MLFYSCSSFHSRQGPCRFSFHDELFTSLSTIRADQTLIRKSDFSLHKLESCSAIPYRRPHSALTQRWPADRFYLLATFCQRSERVGYLAARIQHLCCYLWRRGDSCVRNEYARHEHKTRRQSQQPVHGLLLLLVVSMIRPVAQLPFFVGAIPPK